MTAWFLLSLVTGPVVSVHLYGPSGSHPETTIATRVVAWAVSAFFAWRVTRGGRISRMLLILTNGGGFITLVVALAKSFELAELGLLALVTAQLALLLSPAVYRRTRAGVEPGANVALWRRRQPAPLVTALAAGAALGLAGMAVCAGAVSDRGRDYDNNTVHVPAGHPVGAILSSGRYAILGGCANGNGCVLLKPQDLSIRGYLSGPIAVLADEGGQEPDVGDEWVFRDLDFMVPVSEPVLFTRLAHPQMTVIIVPAQDKADAVRRWKVSEDVFGLLLLASLAGLAKPVRRGTPGRW